MLQLFISDFMVTSGAYAYWQAGELDFFITPEMVPTTSPIQLNTTYFNDLIPQLYSRYPGRLMYLNVTVAAMPTVNFNSSGALVTAVTHVDFLVIINNSTVYCFTLEITLHLTGNAHLNGTKIYGDVTYVYADVTLYRTAIGNFSVSNLEDVVQLVVSVGLPIINQKLAEGFVLPVVDGVELVNPLIKFGAHFLAVTTNVKYTPPQINNVFLPPTF